MPHQSMLEIGCDAWRYYVEPSGVDPETLICTNISQRELDLGITAARRSRLQPDFRLMDAHTLDFPDHSFDVVFGMSILHHLELERALTEIRRVLKPSGHLLFAEPLDMNFVGRIVRRLTPEARTDDERPFRDQDLRRPPGLLRLPAALRAAALCACRGSCRAWCSTIPIIR